MKKFLLIPVFALALMLGSLPASAATTMVGNDSTVRTQLDSYSNFTIIDTNHPVSVDGKLTQFNYYAANVNQFHFVLVDSGLVVKWVSDVITPSSAGSHVYTPTSKVTVSAGWNLGVYSVSTGVIPFELTGLPAQYTPNGNGLPVVGSTLANEGSDGRTYSLGATGKVAKDDVADSEKDKCKNGGWVDLGHKNQGQCVSSTVSHRGGHNGHHHGHHVRGAEDSNEVAKSDAGMPDKSNKGNRENKGNGKN